MSKFLHFKSPPPPPPHHHEAHSPPPRRELSAERTFSIAGQICPPRLQQCAHAGARQHFASPPILHFRRRGWNFLVFYRDDSAETHFLHLGAGAGGGRWRRLANMNTARAVAPGIFTMEVSVTSDGEWVGARAGALWVFFYFFNDKKCFFAFFIMLIWLGVSFLNRTGAEIG